MSAPDFAAPVLGFRAWRVECDGALLPWSAHAAGPWLPGPNTARCLHDWAGRDHVPPGRGCSCGIYALADLYDRRLHAGSQAVGAIAGWGEVEVHRTGFRAQYACVLALAVPERASARHREELEAAAERYAVRLVGLAGLEEEALQFAQPLAFDAIPRLRAPATPAAPNPGPPLSSDGARGIACEDHVWARISRGELVVGITRALAAQIQIGSPVSVVQSRLSVGDRLAAIGVGEAELRIGAPVSAWSVEVNPALATDPDLVRVDPEGAGWLARLTPSAWGLEGGSVAWGRAADRVYASALAREADDPFLGVRARWLQAHAHVTSAADVLEELRAARLRPRFASVAEVRQRVVGRLGRALARPEVRERVARAGVRVGWRLREPSLCVVLDFASAAPRALAVDELGGEEMVLSATAETADDYFSGRVDLAAALRAGLVSSSRPAGEVLALESVIKSLHRGYAAEAP